MTPLEVTFRIMIGDLIMLRKWLLPEQIDYIGKAIEYLKKALELEIKDEKEKV